MRLLKWTLGMGCFVVLACLAAAQEAPDAKPAAEAPRTWFVSSKGSDRNPGTEQAPLAKIQSAVTRAKAHDTIVIRSGTYAENVQVDKPLHIEGGDGERVVLKGGGKCGLRITSDDVTVRNLAVVGYVTGILIRKPYMEKAVPEGKLRNVVIENVAIEDGFFGIYAVMCEDLVVTQCVLTNLKSDGIWVSFSSHNATISCNRLSNIGDQGIWVGGHFNRPDVYSNNAQIVGNTIANVRESGVIYAGKKCLIESNTVMRVESGGYSAGAVSLLGRVAEDVEIRDNLICDNLAAGIGIKTQPANVVIRGNRIVRNKAAGIENKSSEPIDARDNWWGDAAGPNDPTKNPAGKGDKIIGNVEFAPWKTKERD